MTSSEKQVLAMSCANRRKNQYVGFMDGARGSEAAASALSLSRPMISPTTPSIVRRELSMTCASSAMVSGEDAAGGIRAVARGDLVVARAAAFLGLPPLGAHFHARRRCKICTAFAGKPPSRCPGLP